MRYLSKEHVVRNAHCEYDHGFLVFNGRDDGKEIWRSSWQGNDVIPRPTIDFPDQAMRLAYGKAERRHGRLTHGHFHPWAHIQTPITTWVFRLVFPTLLTGGFDRYFLYDVPSAQLIQTIHDPADTVQDAWGGVNYVEINEEYVFASRPGGIRVFSRETGNMIFHLDNRQLQAPLLLTTRPLHGRVKDAGLAAQVVIVEPSDLPPTHDRFNAGESSSFFHSFFFWLNMQTVHISSCGSHLVCLRSGQYGLLIIRNFGQVLAGTLTLQDAALAMARDNFNYLAVDGDRFAVGDVRCFPPSAHPRPN
jgi:hypothetical protein